MLEWLLGKKKREGELPLYAALRYVPSRGLPPELAAREADESFAARHEALADLLQEPSRRPEEDEPLFILLLDAGGRGFVTLTLPGDGGPCLPAFSTPLRAADYAQTLSAAGPPVRYLYSCPTEFARLLGDVGGAGITTFALDRCPRCPTFNAVSIGPAMTAGDTLKLWAVFKATELARADLYFEFALDEARAGRLAIAREVALETVGHVTMDDPRPHFLLGQLGVGLSDRGLVREAKTFLGFLGLDAWERKLDEVVRSGSPDFASLV
jgi:hypothetical protein